MRRFSPLVFLLFVFLPLSAHALTAAAVGAAVFRGAAGAATTFQALGAFRANPYALAATVGVGLALTAIEISDTSGSKADFLPGSAANPPFTPAGWSTVETPPSTAPMGVSFSGAAPYYPSATQACSARCAATGKAMTGVDGGGNCQCSGTGWGPSYAAPTGYGACVSGTCQLQTPSAVQWPSDGVPTYRPDPAGTGNWVPHPRDPDVLSGVTPSGGLTTREGKDQYGNPVREIVTVTPDKGSDYERHTESPNPTTGLPKVQVDKIHSDQNGNVTSATTQTMENTKLANSSTNQGNGTQAQQNGDVAGSISSMQSAIVSAEGAVQSAVNNASGVISTAVASIGSAITTAVGNSASAISGAVSSIGSSITSAVNTASSAITSAVTTSMASVRTAVDAVKDSVTAIPAPIVTAISGLQTAVNAVRDAVVAVPPGQAPVMDDVKDAINTQGQAIRDKLSEGDAIDIPEDTLADNPADMVLPNDHMPDPDQQSLDDARDSLFAASGRFIVSVDNYTQRTGLKDYLNGFFPSSTSSAACSAASFTFPNLVTGANMTISIDCRLIVMVGDCMVMLASAVAYNIIRSGRA